MIWLVARSRSQCLLEDLQLYALVNFCTTSCLVSLVWILRKYFMLRSFLMILDLMAIILLVTYVPYRIFVYIPALFPPSSIPLVALLIIFILELIFIPLYVILEAVISLATADLIENRAGHGPCMTSS